MKNITKKELFQIEQQLGRTPRGIVAIASRHAKTQVVQVLQMRSWVDDEPFPTLFWLSSKDLHLRIAQLETDGLVKQLQDEVNQSEALKAELYEDQKRYCQMRWQQMPAEDRQAIEQKGLTELFHSFGIGGIKNWHNIRCLHMHYAHHLADKNCIGRILDERFGLCDLIINQ